MANETQIAQVGRYIAQAYASKLLAKIVSEDDDALSDESEKDEKGKGK